jgi:hypothetical protein
LRQVYHAKTEALFKLPSGFNSTDAAVLEPLELAIHATDLAKIRLGSNRSRIGANLPSNWMRAAFMIRQKLWFKKRIPELWT